MGFSTIAANLIMFIAVISVAGVVVVVLNNYVTDTSSALVIKKNAMVNQIDTDFSIINVNYNSSTQRLVFYLDNTGRSTLKPDGFFVFVNGVIVNGNDVNETLEPSTNVLDKTLFNPHEILVFNVSVNLTENVTNTLVVAYLNGIKTSDIFSS